MEGGTPELYNRPPRELFNLASDPGQTQNLALKLPGVVAELEGRLMASRSRRMQETGLPDPIEEQGITLQRIGGLKTAVAANRRPVEGNDRGRFGGYDGK